VDEVSLRLNKVPFFFLDVGVVFRYTFLLIRCGLFVGVVWDLDMLGAQRQVGIESKVLLEPHYVLRRVRKVLRNSEFIELTLEFACRGSRRRIIKTRLFFFQLGLLLLQHALCVFQRFCYMDAGD